MAHAMTYTTDMLDCLTLIHQGKVRDSFANVGRYRAKASTVVAINRTQRPAKLST